MVTKLEDVTFGELREFCVKHACGECPLHFRERGYVLCALGTPPVEIEPDVFKTEVDV